MTTSTFSHAAAGRTGSPAAQTVRDFLVAWFQATPAYILYRALAH